MSISWLSFSALKHTAVAALLAATIFPGDVYTAYNPLKQGNLMNTRPQVNIQIKQGNTSSNFVITLDAEKSPKTTENFLAYVNAGFFNNTIFHRVIDNFMIQGGGFESNLKQKETRASIQNEANNGLKNDKYTVAMARTSDPHSATAQFFINVSDNDFLNYSSPTPNGWGYAVFGKITEGMDIIDKLKSVKTSNSGLHQNVPVEDIVIEQAVVVE